MPTTTLVIQTPTCTQTLKGAVEDFLGPLPSMIQEAFGDGDVVITITSAASEQDTLTSEQIKVISTDVSVCDAFSGRTQNTLRNTGFFHIAILPFVTEAELRKIKNFGKKSLGEVLEFLEENDLGPDTRPKIDRYIIERFGIDSVTLNKLRAQLFTLEFTGVEVAVLTACQMRTLAGAACRDEQDILATLQECHKARWVRNATFDPDELMEKLRRVVRRQGYSLGSPALQKLRPWIAM